MSTLVIATKNKGKLREFQVAFAHYGVDCIGLDAVADVPEPEETGTTFAANALLKANYYAHATGHPCLADDSGLAVDALQGAPGVYSARYAGVHGDDEANNRKLIENLQGITNRTAHYICALALAYPGGRTVEVEGRCSGLIQDEPAGTEGFGYDPYFYVPHLGKTMAQLAIEEKEVISHRGRALRALLERWDNL